MKATTTTSTLDRKIKELAGSLADLQRNGIITAADAATWMVTKKREWEVA